MSTPLLSKLLPQNSLKSPREIPYQNSRSENELARQCTAPRITAALELARHAEISFAETETVFVNSCAVIPTLPTKNRPRNTFV
ncbi:MAG: hypothetical protein ABIE14_02270 [Patescibacteria group bacterium]